MTTLTGEDLRIEVTRVWRVHHRLRVTPALVDMMVAARGWVRCGPPATARKRLREVMVALDAMPDDVSVFERRLVAAHAAQWEN